MKEKFDFRGDGPFHNTVTVGDLILRPLAEDEEEETRYVKEHNAQLASRHISRFVPFPNYPDRGIIGYLYPGSIGYLFRPFGPPLGWSIVGQRGEGER